MFFSDPKTAGASADVLRRWLQPRLATCRSARQSRCNKKAPDMQLSSLRSPTCNGLQQAGLCRGIRGFQNLNPRDPSERRRRERKRLRALWRQRRRWTEIFWRDSIVSMIVWEIKYLFEVVLYISLPGSEAKPNQTHTQLNGNYHC